MVKFSSIFVAFLQNTNFTKFQIKWKKSSTFSRPLRKPEVHVLPKYYLVGFIILLVFYKHLMKTQVHTYIGIQFHI